MRKRAGFAIGAGLVVLAVACGARTPLDLDEMGTLEVIHGTGGAAGASPFDAGTGGKAGAPHDGGMDAPKDAPHDAPKDAPKDSPPDVSMDAPEDAPLDAIPDMNVPDVVKTDCVDQGVTYIYVVTEMFNLYAFDPMTDAFNFIGTINCPVQQPGGSTPFSMAVDRKGIAHVVFQDGELFRVSTKTASCTATTYVPGQFGFNTFGMGFSTNEGGPAETLFIASDGINGNGTMSLGSLDTAKYVVNPIAPISACGVELTGTGDGRLFGFWQEGECVPNGTHGASHLVQIDKKSAAFTADVILPMVDLGQGWAFGFWGGAFYFFTAPTDHSIVTRYAPGTGEIGQIAELPGEVIVGAGVSTCAPED